MNETPMPRKPRRVRLAGQAEDGGPSTNRTRPAKAGPRPPQAVPATTATTAPAVSGKLVVLERQALAEANLDSLDLRQGSIGRVDARSVTVTQGAVGGARADHLSVSQGALGGALAGEVTVSQSAVGSVIARDARIEQSVVRTVVAQNVRVERPSAILVMLAQRVEGDVRALLDWRAAAAFGAAFGFVAALVRRGRR